MKRKFMVLVTIISIISMLGATTVLAADSNNNAKGTEIVAAYRVTENGLVPLDQQDLAALESSNNDAAIAKHAAKSMTENNTQKNSSFSPASAVFYYTYDQSGYIDAFPKHDLRARISQYVYNYTQDNVIRSVEASTTQSYTVNISLTTEKRAAFTATLGGSWSSSASYSDSITCQINPGYKSWIEFTPIMHNSWGYMKY